MVTFTYNTLNSVNTELKKTENRLYRFRTTELKKRQNTLLGKMISVAKVTFAILLCLPISASITILNKVTAFIFGKVTEAKENRLKKKFVSRLSCMVQNVRNVQSIFLQISLIPKDFKADPSVKHFDSVDNIKPKEFDFKGMHGYSIGYISKDKSKFVGEVDEVVDYGMKGFNSNGQFLTEEGYFTEFTPPIKLSDIPEN